MKLDPVLLEILVCPDCKGSLTVDYEHQELICNSCGLIYPVRDDIPVMLVDEARRPDPPPAPAVEEQHADEGATGSPPDEAGAPPREPATEPDA
jgi:uncharacterized protein